MKDIEIYIKNLNEEETILWVKNKFGSVTATEIEDVKFLETPKGNITIRETEDSSFTSLFFNMNNFPWQSDLECAKEAFALFGKDTRCEPSSKYPNAASSQFIEISKKGEILVNW